MRVAKRDVEVEPDPKVDCLVMELQLKITLLNALATPDKDNRERTMFQQL